MFSMEQKDEINEIGKPKYDLCANDTTLIKQGAEAKVYKTKWFGKEAIVKERFKKEYRHPTLDQKITEKRIVQEGKNMMKCLYLGIDVPALYFIDHQHHNRIFMEYVHGCTVKQYLSHHGTSESESIKLAFKIGQTIAKIHDEKIVHGDLTTSNMLLRNHDPENLVIIDFGLSYTTTMEEDKAVDLYVLERAMLSTHPNSKILFQELLKGYEYQTKKKKVVLEKLNQVRLRGRKRDMVG